MIKKITQQSNNTTDNKETFHDLMLIILKEVNNQTNLIKKKDNFREHLFTLSEITACIEGEMLSFYSLWLSGHFGLIKYNQEKSIKLNIELIAITYINTLMVCNAKSKHCDDIQYIRPFIFRIISLCNEFINIEKQLKTNGVVFTDSGNYIKNKIQKLDPSIAPYYTGDTLYLTQDTIPAHLHYLPHSIEKVIITSETQHLFPYFIMCNSLTNQSEELRSEKSNLYMISLQGEFKKEILKSMSYQFSIEITDETAAKTIKDLPYDSNHSESPLISALILNSVSLNLIKQIPQCKNIILILSGHFTENAIEYIYKHFKYIMIHTNLDKKIIKALPLYPIVEYTAGKGKLLEQITLPNSLLENSYNSIISLKDDITITDASIDSIPDNLGILLAGQAIKKYIYRLHQTFNLVIFDEFPAGLTIDSSNLRIKIKELWLLGKYACNAFTHDGKTIFPEGIEKIKYLNWYQFLPSFVLSKDDNLFHEKMKKGVIYGEEKFFHLRNDHDEIHILRYPKKIKKRIAEIGGAKNIVCNFTLQKNIIAFAIASGAITIDRAAAWAKSQQTAHPNITFVELEGNLQHELNNRSDPNQQKTKVEKKALQKKEIFEPESKPVLLEKTETPILTTAITTTTDTENIETIKKNVSSKPSTLPHQSHQKKSIPLTADSKKLTRSKKKSKKSQPIKDQLTDEQKHQQALHQTLEKISAYKYVEPNNDESDSDSDSKKSDIIENKPPYCLQDNLKVEKSSVTESSKPLIPSSDTTDEKTPINSSVYFTKIRPEKDLPLEIYKKLEPYNILLFTIKSALNIEVYLHGSCIGDLLYGDPCDIDFLFKLPKSNTLPSIRLSPVNPNILWINDDILSQLIKKLPALTRIGNKLFYLGKALDFSPYHKSTHDAVHATLLYDGECIIGSPDALEIAKKKEFHLLSKKGKRPQPEEHERIKSIFCTNPIVFLRIFHRTAKHDFTLVVPRASDLHRYLSTFSLENFQKVGKDWCYVCYKLFQYTQSNPVKNWLNLYAECLIAQILFGNAIQLPIDLHSLQQRLKILYKKIDDTVPKESIIYQVLALFLHYYQKYAPDLIKTADSSFFSQHALNNNKDLYQLCTQQRFLEKQEQYLLRTSTLSHGILSFDFEQFQYSLDDLREKYYTNNATQSWQYKVILGLGVYIEDDVRPVDLIAKKLSQRLSKYHFNQIYQIAMLYEKEIRTLNNTQFLTKHDVDLLSIQTCYPDIWQRYFNSQSVIRPHENTIFAEHYANNGLFSAPNNIGNQANSCGQYMSGCKGVTK